MLAFESKSAIPAGHGEQKSDPVGAYSPLAHGTQVVFDRPSWSCCPAVQRLHTVAAMPAVVFEPPEYEPDSQIKHGVDDEASVSAVPAAQSLQELAPTDEYWPTAHMTHGVLAFSS